MIVIHVASSNPILIFVRLREASFHIPLDWLFSLEQYIYMCFSKTHDVNRSRICRFFSFHQSCEQILCLSPLYNRYQQTCRHRTVVWQSSALALPAPLRLMLL